MENEQKLERTDLEMANEALAALKPNVTASDRKECDYNLTLVAKYLDGRGTSLDTAVELLEFFRERIENRRKIIANEL